MHPNINQPTPFQIKKPEYCQSKQTPIRHVNHSLSRLLASRTASLRSASWRFILALAWRPEIGSSPGLLAMTTWLQFKKGQPMWVGLLKFLVGLSGFGFRSSPSCLLVEARRFASGPVQITSGTVCGEQVPLVVDDFQKSLFICSLDIILDERVRTVSSSYFDLTSFK